MANFTDLPTELQLTIVGHYLDSFGGYLKADRPKDNHTKAANTEPKREQASSKLLEEVKVAATLNTDHSVAPKAKPNDELSLSKPLEEVVSANCIKDTGLGPTALLLVSNELYRIAYEPFLQGRTTCFWLKSAFKTTMQRHAARDTTKLLHSITLDCRMSGSPKDFAMPMAQLRLKSSPLKRIAIRVHPRTLTARELGDHLNALWGAFKVLRPILPEGLQEYVVTCPEVEKGLQGLLDTLLCGPYRCASLWELQIEKENLSEGHVFGEELTPEVFKDLPLHVGLDFVNGCEGSGHWSREREEGPAVSRIEAALLSRLRFSAQAHELQELNKAIADVVIGKRTVGEIEEEERARRAD